MDHYQRKAKHASVDLTNFTGDPKKIKFLELEWPTSNGSLRQITLDGLVIWQGNAPGLGTVSDTQTVTIGDLILEPGEVPPADYDTTPWIADLVARTLDGGMTEKLTFHFTEKAGADAVYSITLNFAGPEGNENACTYLNITIDKDTRGGRK